MAEGTLARILRERIARDGPIPFADYMREALYHPDHGYYARGPRIGADGDFFTASDLAAFGRALARQAIDAWEALGRPPQFTVVEMGGGSGALARSMREAFAGRADFLAGSRHVLVEPSRGLAARQREGGFEVVPALSSIPPGPAFLLANEVLDALPVHRVTTLGGRLREARVGFVRGRFVETFDGVPSSALVAAVAEGDAHPEEGEVFEVRLDVEELLREVERVLAPGYAIFLDYGDDARTLLATRPRGTLRAYRGHRIEDDVLGDPGEKDLTADVDFSAVRRLATAAGLEVAGETTQGRFLVALGAIEDLAARQEAGDAAGALAIKTLVLPGGMGERFRVLGLSKGAPKALRGFSAPW